MNYRHIYHAGNKCDIFKHLLYIELLKLMTAKGKPIAVVDTHAGLGLYKLNSAEAMKTNESEFGVKKLYRHKKISEFPEFAEIIDILNGGNTSADNLNYYPGSLYIANALLSDADKLYACELHEDDFHSLEENCTELDIRAKLYNQNGFEFLKSVLPFKGCSNGIVFIDPPFEKVTELQDILNALYEALKRMSSPVYCIWYPIKPKYDYNSFFNILLDLCKKYPNISNIMNVKMKFARADNNLLGNGMFIINYPWKLEESINKLQTVLSEMKLGKIEVTKF